MTDLVRAAWGTYSLKLDGWVFAGTLPEALILLGNFVWNLDAWRSGAGRIMPQASGCELAGRIGDAAHAQIAFHLYGRTDATNWSHAHEVLCDLARHVNEWTPPGAVRSESMRLSDLRRGPNDGPRPGSRCFEVWAAEVAVGEADADELPVRPPRVWVKRRVFRTFGRAL